jgi:parallel beta-helix repeat protein
MKRLILVILALMLFASTIYADTNVSTANAATSLPNYELYSGGAGSTQNIHWDGAKFTLTADVEGTITLMDDGVLFDGAGFTVKGQGDSVGIAVYDKNGVTVENVKVENFQIGILLGHTPGPGSFLWYDPNPNRCVNCTISNCQLSSNAKGISMQGIESKISGNQATNNTEGILVYGSEHVFRNNHMKNNTFNFEDTTNGQCDVDSSNTVDGKPIYYLVNKQNVTVPADAGMVQLKDCTNVLVKNLKIEHTYKAISLLNSSDCKIYNNKVTANEIGTYLRNSTKNSIIGNELLNNKDNAIEIYDSDNTIITNNLIRRNGGGIDSIGYSISGSQNVVISSNQIIENGGCGIQAGIDCTITGNYIAANGQHGIYFWDMSHSVVDKNSIIENKVCGINFRNGNNASIAGNDISKNRVGIEMGVGYISYCTITENNIAYNTNFAIAIYSDPYSDVKNNYFYHNNFINNNNGDLQVKIRDSKNIWSKNSVGNYWSDYNSTINGEVYKIDNINIDRYPQKTPFPFAQLGMQQAGLAPPTTLPSTPQLPETDDNFAWLTVASTALIVGIITATLLYRQRKKSTKITSLRRVLPEQSQPRLLPSASPLTAAYL